MVIGKDLSILRKNKLTGRLISIVGTLDLHSQLRLQPVIKFFSKHFSLDRKLNILELGCGDGILGFELLKVNKNIYYTGIDVSENSINTAKYLSSVLKSDKQLSFICSDVKKMAYSNELKKIDVLLLVDFIEHIENPFEILNMLKNYLNDSSIIIISVPTPNFVKYFGKDFNKKVGHISCSGFKIEEIKEPLNSLNLELIFEKYNTGFISNIGCALFYRFIFSNKYFELIKSLLLYLFKYLDFVNNSRISCSLFTVFCVRKCTTI